MEVFWHSRSYCHVSLGINHLILTFILLYSTHPAPYPTHIQFSFIVHSQAMEPFLHLCHTHVHIKLHRFNWKVETNIVPLLKFLDSQVLQNS